jgi:hypothetical protein
LQRQLKITPLVCRSDSLLVLQNLHDLQSLHDRKRILGKDDRKQKSAYQIKTLQQGECLPDISAQK